MLLTFIIVLSKIAGFVREMVMAAYFGLSIESDAYGVAYSILSIFTILFGAAIGSTFIPIYTKTRLAQGEEKANDYASSVLNLYILAAIGASILGYLFAPALCGVMWQNPEGMDTVVNLTRIMMPSMVFWAISGVLVNILDARKHFVPEQIIGFALSFCVILACVVFGTIEAAAAATGITAAVQVVMLLPFMRKQFRYQRKMNLKDEKIKRTFILALPALISIAFDEINHAMDKIFGSAISIGVVTALSKSYVLVQTAVSVLIVPITTVMFTQLSGYAAKKEMGRLKDTVRKSIEIVALITLPIIVLAFILQNDMIAVFYQRGEFTEQQTMFTAPIFAFYIVGIFGFGLRNFLTRVFYSLQKTKIPMLIGIVSVSLNIALDIILKDVMGAKGLTLATSIASLTGAAIMLAVLRRQLGNMHLKKSAAQFLRIVLCAAVCAVVTWLLYRNIGITGANFTANLGRLLICGIAGLAVYGVMTFALRVETAGRLMAIVKAKLRRRKA